MMEDITLFVKVTQKMIDSILIRLIYSDSILWGMTDFTFWLHKAL